MKKRYQKYIIYFLFFIVIVFLAEILVKLGGVSLKENGQTTNGVFLASKLFNGSTSIEFEYEVNGCNYLETDYSIYQVFKNQEKLRGKLFPVILHSQNPEKVKMLILKSDFEELGLVRPDSLNWVCDSLHICD